MQNIDIDCVSVAWRDSPAVAAIDIDDVLMS